MAYNSKFNGKQIEEGVEKALADLELVGASVNIQMVDENTPASGTVTKEPGSNRARFDFKIPGIKDTGWKEWVLPEGACGSFEVQEEARYRYRNGILYLDCGSFFRYRNAPYNTPLFDTRILPEDAHISESLRLLYSFLDINGNGVKFEFRDKMILVVCDQIEYEFTFNYISLPLF